MIEIHDRLPKKKYSLDSFEIDTGGVNHPSGYGSWKIRLDKNGVMVIHHAIVREKRRFGPFKLEEETNEQLWKIIYALGFEEEPLRKGRPEEPLYVLSLWQDGVSYLKKTWSNDFQKTQGKELLELLKSLIEGYTQETPIF